MGRALKVGAALAGTAVLGGSVYYFFLVDAGKTGDPELDALRWRTAFELARRGLVSSTHMRAMMSIFHTEHSKGDPDSKAHGILDVGDQDLRVGPSIGPGQISRRLAIWLGLWPADPAGLDAQLDDPDDAAAYLAFGTDPANMGTMLSWAVEGYKAILTGDERLPAHNRSDGSVWGDQGAVRIWNGPGATAVAYREKASNFASAKWGASEVA